MKVYSVVVSDGSRSLGHLAQKKRRSWTQTGYCFFRYCRSDEPLERLTYCFNEKDFCVAGASAGAGNYYDEKPVCYCSDYCDEYFCSLPLGSLSHHGSTTASQ